MYVDMYVHAVPKIHSGVTGVTDVLSYNSSPVANLPQVSVGEQEDAHKLEFELFFRDLHDGGG